MATPESLEARVDALEDEVRRLRRDVGRSSLLATRSREERLAALEEIRRVREEILRHRDGVPLPSMAGEIARMREERSEELLNRM